MIYYQKGIYISLSSIRQIPYLTYE